MVALASKLALVVAAPTAAHAAGSWSWPVVGPVIRAYDPPDTPYGAGHRGVDIACARGAAIRAVAAGTVSFAGSVGGQRYVTVDHGGGLQSTYSWVAQTLVRKGQVVAVGASVATCGEGHPGSTTPHVHLGARSSGVYLDPLPLLGPIDLSGFLRLAPRA
ncbi:MAG: murein hydrolase activator EnvC family protein [Actinomycetota bacterium]